MIAEFILCHHPNLLLANLLHVCIPLIYEPFSGTSGCLLFIALAPHSYEWRNVAFSSLKALHAPQMQPETLQSLGLVFLRQEKSSSKVPELSSPYVQ